MAKHRVLQALRMGSGLRLSPGEEEEEDDGFSDDANLSLPYLLRRINLRRVVWQETRYPGGFPSTTRFALVTPGNCASPENLIINMEQARR